MTTTDGQYVPSEAEMMIAWHRHATAEDAKHARLRDDSESTTKEFVRYMARVRRDGAREALDGYADAEEDSFLALHVKGAPISAAQCTHAAMTAR